MHSQQQFRLTMLTASMAAMFAPALHAAGAGQVDFATPGVNAVGPNGQSRPLAKGAEVQPGEVIDTGTGRAQLRFTDGGFVSLAPQTQFKLESYGYDKDDPKKNGIVMNLLKGGLRSITGLIGKTNRDGYKLQTATATVGIRGTEFSITGFPDGSVVFHAADGTISVTNNAGTSEVSGGQSVNVSSPNSAPVKTDEKPFLPPVVSAVQTQIPQPQNPVQDSNAVAAVGLTGTYAGQWRAVTGYSYGNGEGSTYSYANISRPQNGYAGKFTVSPSGHVTSMGYASPNGSFTFSRDLGSASAQSYGNDGVMAWGRWIGSGGTSTSNGNVASNDYSGAALHYVVGLPMSAMPTTGTATYNMYGGTAPSCLGPACGAITVGSSITLNFGSYEGSYTMSVANAGDGVKLSGSGYLGLSSDGTFGGSGSMNTVSGSAALNGSAGSSTLDGFLAGPGATHAGAGYVVNYQAASATGNTTIYGAAVYKK